MGKLSEYLDYLNADTKKLTWEYITTNYHHFTVSKRAKKARRTLRMQKTKI